MSPLEHLRLTPQILTLWSIESERLCPELSENGISSSDTDSATSTKIMPFDSSTLSSGMAVYLCGGRTKETGAFKFPSAQMTTTHLLLSSAKSSPRDLPDGFQKHFSECSAPTPLSEHGPTPESGRSAASRTAFLANTRRGPDTSPTERAHSHCSTSGQTHTATIRLEDTRPSSSKKTANGWLQPKPHEQSLPHYLNGRPRSSLLP